MLKKTLLILFVVILSFALCGCQSQDNKAQAQESQENNVQAQEPQENKTQTQEPTSEANQTNTFSIRNGVKFGMTRQQVEEIETNNGSRDFSGDYTLYVKNVEIAGFNGATIGYQFNDAGKLTTIDYSWDKRWNKESSSSENDFSKGNVDSQFKLLQDQFDTLNESLSSKYELLGQMSGRHDVEYIPLSDENNDVFYNPFNWSDLSDTDVYNFRQYLAKDGNDYVEIVIVCFRKDWYPMTDVWHTQLNKIDLHVRISYRTITEAQMNEKLEQADKLKKKRDSDL